MLPNAWNFTDWRQTNRELLSLVRILEAAQFQVSLSPQLRRKWFPLKARSQLRLESFWERRETRAQNARNKFLWPWEHDIKNSSSIIIFKCFVERMPRRARKFGGNVFQIELRNYPSISAVINSESFSFFSFATMRNALCCEFWNVPLWVELLLFYWVVAHSGTICKCAYLHSNMKSEWKGICEEEDFPSRSVSIDKSLSVVALLEMQLTR